MHVPGWHERTRQLQDDDELTVIGIIQEQHPDRCRLFMQWKEMDWPILVDSLNLLGLRVVPVMTLVDEHGVVRAVNPSQDDLDTFLSAEYSEPDALFDAKDLTEWNVESIVQALQSDDLTVARLGEIGSIAFRLSQTDREDHSELLNLALDAYERAVDADPQNGPLHFQLGVAYRARYDSGSGEPDDFQSAIDHWIAAREVDPNQYIWRRRIQQYGPRLDKPYSFYDWISEARNAIRERGETPVDLRVEPRGAELAEPRGAELAERKSELSGDPSLAGHPDPEGRIERDSGLVHVSTTVVPHTASSTASGRAHVIFNPAKDLDGHWNNEAEPMVVWIEAPEGWTITPRGFTIPNADEATSEETRSIEFEITRGDRDARDQDVKGVALYNVCRGEAGVCLYRRLPFTISLDALIDFDNADQN